MENESYLTGFGNHHQSEALTGALPLGQNSPQKHPLGLYAEQLSGSAFTVTRRHNLRSWLYRILPSVKHGAFKSINYSKICSYIENGKISPEQLRWSPLPFPEHQQDFLHGMVTFAMNGDVQHGIGAAIHLYSCNQSMQGKYFYNSDGELLVVLQTGQLDFRTEFGFISAEPNEIVVIPRGVKFQVECDNNARGYILENYGQPLSLAERGPIGANGLANERDFLAPKAAFEEKSGKFKLITKFQGHLWECDIDHSPLDVVGWHGTYYPYKYDLRRFNTINTVSFDHLDPSIFTVLSSLSDTPGTANVDFVIFPERWMVAEHTFRPPYYHRNLMNEYMGLIHGTYDAKQEGFLPGGGSLHNCMSAHGPDAETYTQAAQIEALKPQYYSQTLAFMFESRYVWMPTPFALQTDLLQKNYFECWQDLKAHFSV